MKKAIFFAILLIITTISCNKNHYFEDSVEIPQGNWDLNQIVKFTVNIDDISTPYSLFVNIVHGDNYPYRNLWIFIKSTAPNGNYQFDTLNCILTDDDYKWIGKKQNNLLHITNTFADSVEFSEPGNYTFEIQQALRQDIVPSINKIGFTIDKLN
ncbi:MAG: gliding motility lipoprotein GldH [Bacteroidales bacterium]|nr:gliding motility lipoprotein GldH [Bacteroidales bacterium]